MTRALAAYTFVWLAVYVPAETAVTFSHTGLGGLVYNSYPVNVVGMGLMLWGAVSSWTARRFGPGLLAAGWSWMTATCWRATVDRYWASANGFPLYFGPRELWFAPVITVLALLPLIGALAAVRKQS